MRFMSCVLNELINHKIASSDLGLCNNERQSQMIPILNNNSCNKIITQYNIINII